MRNKKVLKVFLPLSLMMVAVLVATIILAPHFQASASGGVTNSVGTPRFYIVPKNPTTSALLMHARPGSVNTIPFWTSSFTYNGTTYPFQMVGTDPSAGSHTTTVPVVLLPLKITFSNGTTLNGSTKVASTEQSPIFQAAQFLSGNTQYGDAIQRAEFWSIVNTANNSNYHVLLGTPTVHAPLTLKVPASKGKVVKSKTGKKVGEIDVNWFDAQIQKAISKDKLSPQTLPIFLSYNTFLYQGSPSQCCILGYHNALGTYGTSSTIQTYAYAAYSDPGLFGTTPIEDIDALSHEISEWYNDPFTDNTVPNWSVPSEPQYGCSNVLETGDPLVGTAFTVNGYHPQDEAFLSWFARQSPSIGYDGRYTYLGTFTTVAPSC